MQQTQAHNTRVKQRLGVGLDELLGDVMGTATAEERVAAARKAHECSWCGEQIGVGESYTRYRWFRNGDAGTCRMHPECLLAMRDAANDEGGWIDFMPGDNERPTTSPNTPPDPTRQAASA